MTPNKPTISASSTQAIIPECCMCGDSGLSHELFHCKVCKFRSQHRYCSNLYPKAEYYRVCNWCLCEKDNKNSQNSSNSSSSTKTSGEGDIKSKKRNNIQGGLKGRSGNSPLKPSSPIKKVQRSPERSSSPDKSRKKIVMNKALEEKLMRRRSSGDLLNSKNENGIVKKHVFRNKVRRYKLLEEVSS
ncbi:hypothetical protein HS088_TW12G00979 [Tripterygium wilfordii]|uniref:PHD-type zinc finger plants domain-containing protein n=1 Tax=Tripterygium wilfordii TaxID=458696 RepID=A0A7J7D0J9_TRIWF|nr:uncharacterized protein LOC120011436 [Tripterygium wilfordii]KAF5739769.1 hypothetical protein HS088_TW12G00979 [Tripterygium wilfordii]